MAQDSETNRLTGRVSRYARVGAGVGGVAARIAGARLFGRDLGDQRNAADLAATLGGLKGPLMKIAQLLATIPDVLPPEFATELQKLQAEAPPMGPAFVRRRMRSELGPDWESRFADFDMKPAAAASKKQSEAAALRAKLLSLQKANAAAKQKIAAAPAAAAPAAAPTPAPAAATAEARRKARAERFSTGGAPAPAPAPPEADE